ncbi:MAG: O-antigen polymerase [Rhizobiaceae bacterium]
MTPYVAIKPAERLLLVAAIFLLATVSAVAAAMGNDLQLFVAFGFAVYAAVIMAMLVYSRESDGWFHPLVFMAAYWCVLRFVLPQIPVLISGLEGHVAMKGASASELNFIAGWGFVMSALGWQCFFAAYHLSNPKWRLRLQNGGISHPTLKVSIIVGVSALAFAYLSFEVGGVGKLLMQRSLIAELRPDQQIEGRHWHFLAGISAHACVAWFAINHQIWKRPSFIVLFALGLFFDYAATGSRSGLILPLMIVGTIWTIRERRLPYKVIIVGLVFSIMFIGIAGQLRKSPAQRAQSNTSVTLDISPIKQFEFGLRNIVRYGTETEGLYGVLYNVPDRVDWLYGRSYVSLLFPFIPSSLLPFEKPPTGGLLSGQLIFKKRKGTGIPPGNVGEAYWNFHIPGIVVIMCVFGIVMKTLARNFEEQPENPIVIIVFVYTLFLLQPNSPSFYHWVHGLVPALITAVLLLGIPKFGLIWRDGADSPA